MSTLKLVTTPTALNPVEHDLELDEDHQIVWVGLDRNSDEDQGTMVAQSIKTRLLMFLGEWYQDLRQGVPWKQRMFDKGTTDTERRQIIRHVIQETPGVSEVKYVRIVANDPITRAGSVSFEATSDRGFTITVQEMDVPFIVPTTEGEVADAY